MKKTLMGLFICLSVFSYNLGTVQAVTYTYTANPNYPSNKIVAVSIKNDGIQCQTFTPTTVTLANYFYVMVDGYDRDATMFAVNLHEANPPEGGPQVMPGEFLGDYRATTIGAKPNGYTNSLEMTKFTNSSVSEVNVDLNKKYMICVRYSETYNPDVNGDLVWYSDPSGSYDGGYAFSMGRPLGEEIPGVRNLNYDFGFAIYNKVAQADPPANPGTTTTPVTTTTPSATGTPAANTPLPTGVTAGSGAAPATPTASIKAPTELTASDAVSDQGGSIKLDWKASVTTDISGYKIFRSTEEKKGFAEIAKTTDKAIVTYTDNAASIGQKYYYLVRAYKDTKESASSNTVSATSADNLAPIAPANFTYSKNALDYAFNWDKNTEADLAGYSFIIASSTDPEKVLETIEISKDLNTYELIVGDHQLLSVEGSYVFTLVAKDTNGNLSEKSVATEKVTATATAVSTKDNSKEKNNTLWYVLCAVLILGVAGFSVYWFKFRKKKMPSAI